MSRVTFAPPPDARGYFDAQPAAPERPGTPALGRPPQNVDDAGTAAGRWRSRGRPRRTPPFAPGPAAVLGPSLRDLREAPEATQAAAPPPYAPTVLPTTIAPWPLSEHAVGAPLPPELAWVEVPAAPQATPPQPTTPERRVRRALAASPPPTGPLPPLPAGAALSVDAYAGYAEGPAHGLESGLESGLDTGLYGGADSPDSAAAAGARSWVQEARDSPRRVQQRDVANRRPGLLARTARAVAACQDDDEDDDEEITSAEAPATSPPAGQSGPEEPSTPLTLALQAVGCGKVSAPGELRTLQRWLRARYRTPGMPCPLELLKHVDQLDRLHHGLARIAGSPPALWPYPTHHPRQPSYRRTVDGGYPLACRDAREALRQLAATTSSSIWETVTLRVRELQLGDPDALTAAFRRLEAHLAALVDAWPEAREAGGSAVLDAARRRKKAAQLTFSLAVERGAHRAAGHALGHYAQFAAVELDADGGQRPAYDGHPLPPQEFHAWLQRCPLAQLAAAPLWHRGLRTTVSYALLSACLARLHPEGGAPATLAERWARAAARHGRLPDGAWMRALHCALEQAPYMNPARAQQSVATLASGALLARRGGSLEAFAHLPMLLVHAEDGAPALWRRQALRRAANAPATLTDAELLQLLAEADAANEADLLLPLRDAAPRRYEDPRLGVPLLLALLPREAQTTPDPRELLDACADVFDHLRAGATATRNDGALDEERVLAAADALLRQSASHGAADVTDRVLHRLAACKLRCGGV